MNESKKVSLRTPRMHQKLCGDLEPHLLGTSVTLGLSDRNNVITGRICQLAVDFNCDELQTLLALSGEFNGDRRAIVQNDSDSISRCNCYNHVKG